MRIEYRITLRDFIAGRRHTAAHSPSWRARMAHDGPSSALVAVTLILETFVARAHFSLALWCSAALVSAYIGYLVYRFQRTKSDYLSAQTVHDHAWLEAGDDGLCLPDGAVPWGALRQCVELKDMFLLYRDDAHAVIVPKRRLPADEVFRFRDLLQTMAGRYAVPWQR